MRIKKVALVLQRRMVVGYTIVMGAVNKGISSPFVKPLERTQRETAKENSGLGNGPKSHIVYSPQSKSQSDGDLTIKGSTNMNDNYKILQKMLEAFRNNGYAQVKGYNRFGYLRETDTAVFVSRETGKNTRVPFDKVLL